ncbi:Oxalate:formate antiporter [bacterium HR29]|jgi:sugar phosphate permease|nr:Oxalate:formate antiporter [bacterium HR29]
MVREAVRIPPAARILPRRWFYGWYIALACAALMFVGMGVGYYGLAVYLSPLKEAHGWSTTAVSGATGLYFSVMGLTSAFVGPRIDERGPLRFMVVGMLLCGVAASLIGFVRELWQLYAVYAALAVAIGMSAGVAINAIMTRWFVRRRARAMSISATGVSLGGVVLSPLISRLIDVGGLELAAPAMGALIVAVALPVILLVIAWDPAEMGLHPDGLPLEEAPVRGTLAASVQLRRWTPREAVRTVPFWAILVAFLLVLLAQTGYVIHQIAFLSDRMGSRSEAAFALSVTAFGSIVARLVVGSFADALDKRFLTVVLLVVQASAVVGIVLVENLVSTWLLTLVFGFTIGNVYMMQSLLVGEIFGLVSFGSIFGLVNFAGQVGSGGGPFLVGLLEDLTGSYTVPFMVTAGLTYLAAVVILFARPVAAAAPTTAAQPQAGAAVAGGDGA